MVFIRGAAPCVGQYHYQEKARSVNAHIVAIKDGRLACDASGERNSLRGPFIHGESFGGASCFRPHARCSASPRDLPSRAH
jgi:hypothetical protein